LLFHGGGIQEISKVFFYHFTGNINKNAAYSFDIHMHKSTYWCRFAAQENLYKSQPKEELADLDWQLTMPSFNPNVHVFS